MKYFNNENALINTQGLTNIDRFVFLLTLQSTKKKSKRKPHAHSRSYAPGSISSAWDADGMSVLVGSIACFYPEKVTFFNERFDSNY